MKSDVVIVGGGVAGCCLGYFLSKAKLKVTLLESREVSSGGSGNWSGLVTPYPCLQDSNVAPWHIEVFKAALELKPLLSRELKSFRSCGAVQFGVRDRVAEIIGSKRDVAFGEVITEHEVTEVTGIATGAKAIFYKDSFALDPRELCRFYCRDIEVLEKERVIRLKKTDTSWKVYTDKSEFDARFVIAASAFDVSWLNLSWFQLEPVKGQVVSVPERDVRVSPKSAICFDGYIVPPIDGALTFGAAYEHRAANGDIDSKFTQEICIKAQKWLGGEAVDRGNLTARASFRASTFDRMPFIGELPDLESVGRDWREVSKFEDRALPRLKGLYCSVGHGSRGISSSILAAKLLASAIVGEPSNYSSRLIRGVDPARLLLRKIKRSELH